MGRQRNNLRKKGDKWYGRYVDALGKQRECALSPNKAAATQMIREIQQREDRKRRGLEVEQDLAVELAPLLEEYLADLANRCSAKYLGHASREIPAILEEIGAETAFEVTRTAVRAVRDRMLSDGRAYKTVKTSIGYLKTFLAWAASEDRIPLNPLSGLKPLKITADKVRRPKYPVTMEEAALMVAAARAIDADRAHYACRIPQAPLLEAALATGIRFGAMRQLRWEDLRLDDGVWRFHVRAATTKTKKARVVPVPAWLASSLSTLRSCQGKALGRLPSDGDFVFLGARGGRLRTPNTLRYLHSVLERAGVPRFRDDGSRIDWHSLRAAYITGALERGLDVATVAEAVGHASIQTTMRYVKRSRLPVDRVIEDMPDLGRKGANRGQGDERHA